MSETAFSFGSTVCDAMYQSGIYFSFCSTEWGAIVLGASILIGAAVALIAGAVTVARQHYQI